MLSGETGRSIKRRKGSFDRVLVDAPCSGTGTWWRNPDARWRVPREGGLDDLVALQARILASAAQLVKPGGRLVYATCSLLEAKNGAQVARFLPRTRTSAECHWRRPHRRWRTWTRRASCR